MRYAIDPHSGGDYYQWRLISKGRTVATSGEWFYSQSNAKVAASRFKARCSKWNYEVYGDLKGIYRWRAKASDNKMVAASVDTFSSLFSARTAASTVRDNGGKASGP